MDIRRHFEDLGWGNKKKTSEKHDFFLKVKIAKSVDEKSEANSGQREQE